MVFRGILQKQLSRLVAHPVVAVWISAAIFSAVHLQFQGFLPRLLLGALLGYLFYWTKNLWVSIAAHAFNNSLSLAGVYFSGAKLADLDKIQKDSGVSIWIALASLVLAFGIGRFLRDRYLY